MITTGRSMETVDADARVGPYRIVRKLGSGGMGEVYLAEDSRLHRLVALKTVTIERAGRDGRRRLLKEARAAATLTHPNIAAIYDVVDSAGEAHIVMEYVPGVTLSTRLRTGPLPAPAAVDIARQLADALAAAHAAGVVHRDLKADNVIVDPEGRAKVLDFGLAKVAGADSSANLRGGVVEQRKARRVRGTPPYMSPEQFLGRPVDHRTDIYSLGVVLYELLTGRRPFDGCDEVALVEAVLSGRCSAVRTVNPAVPAALERIVIRAMHRDPHRRYQAAQQLRIDLDRAWRVLTAETTVTRDRPRARRNRRWTAFLAALVAIGSATLLEERPIRSTTSVRARRTSASVVAVLPLANLSGDSSKDDLGVGLAHLLVASLARLPGLTVVPVPSSSRSTLARQDTAKRRAADLGVDLLLEGAVQQATDPLVVTVSLVDGATERVVWAENYELPEADLARFPRRVADDLTRELDLTLSAEDQRQLRVDPTSDRDALAEFTQARAFLERRDVPGNLRRAVDLFQSAIHRDPRFVLAHAGLGEAYWTLYEQTRDPEWTVKARDATAEALRLDPEQPRVHYALAVLYRGRGLTKEAIEEARRAVQWQPRSDDAHRLLGRLLADCGDTEQALAEIREAIALRPNYWEGYSELGHVHLQAGHFDEAIAAFARVTRLQPDCGWGYQMLGAAYQLAGDRARALENYRRALERGPDARAWANIGTIHYAEGRFKDAARAFEEAARLEPAAPAHHRNLADAYRRLGLAAEARRHDLETVALVQESLKVNATDAALLGLLAVSEAKLGRRAEARSHIEQALALSPQSATIRYREAVVCTLVGDYAAGSKALSEALRLGYSAADAQADDDLAPLRGPQAREAKQQHAEEPSSRRGARLRPSAAERS